MHILELSFARPAIALIGMTIVAIPVAAQHAPSQTNSGVSPTIPPDIYEAFKVKVSEKNCTETCQIDAVLIPLTQSSDCQAVYVTREFIKGDTSLAAAPARLRAYPQFSSSYYYYAFSALLTAPRKNLVDICLPQELSTSRGAYRLAWGSEADAEKDTIGIGVLGGVLGGLIGNIRGISLARLPFGRGIGPVVKVTVMSDKPGIAITRGKDQFAFTNKTFRIDSSLLTELKIGIGKNAKFITVACKSNDLVGEIIFHCL